MWTEMSTFQEKERFSNEMQMDWSPTHSNTMQYLQLGGILLIDQECLPERFILFICTHCRIHLKNHFLEHVLLSDLKKGFRLGRRALSAPIFKLDLL